MNDLVAEFKKEAKIIKRKGVKELLEWLETTDFFLAPASTKYHGAHDKGLALHCLSVLDAMTELKKFTEVDVKDESIAICALFHDICKADFYTMEMRNKKIDGKWVEVPFRSVKDQFPMGHGEKSVYLIQKFMDLTDEEALAIRWHMGMADPGVHFNYPSGASCNQAFKQNKLLPLLASADLVASYLLEEWEEEK